MKLFVTVLAIVKCCRSIEAAREADKAADGKGDVGQHRDPRRCCFATTGRPERLTVRGSEDRRLKVVYTAEPALIVKKTWLDDGSFKVSVTPVRSMLDAPGTGVLVVPSPPR